MTAQLAELTVPEVRRLLEVALPLEARSPDQKLAWSQFRRQMRQRARRGHYRRRGAVWSSERTHLPNRPP